VKRARHPGPPADPDPSPFGALPPRVHGRRRDRRGRGIRGPLIPPGLPGERSKAAQFDRLAEAAVARIDRAWPTEMKRIEVVVEEVPRTDPASWEDRMVPLARAFGRRDGQPNRVVLYRRPLEARAGEPGDLPILILDVLVEQVAGLLGKRPEDIDPGYGR
jgi:predicted Zn-dependent protease with MMP-like domain